MYKFKNGFYADVRIEYRYQTEITYQNAKLNNLIQRDFKGAFIRVYDGKMWYYTSTNIINDIQDQLKKLYQIAEYNEDILDDEVVKRFEVNKEEVYKYKNISVKKVPVENKQRLLESYFPLFNKHDDIKNWKAIYIDRYSNYEFYSSKGANIKYDFQTCGISLNYGLSNNGDTFNDKFQKSGVEFLALENQHNHFEECIKESVDFFRNAKVCTPGNYELVLSPIAAGVFAHESFGHKSESDFMVGDETMKNEWSIGKKVGPDILSIVDSGQDPGYGYVPFDDEGTKANKTYLIQDGVLTKRLHSVSTAKILDEEVTGNARAVSTDFEPIVRMTTTYIEGGSLSFDQLIKGVKDGYFIKSINHGSGMSVFTIAPRIAYRIENGKITYPVKISVISGSVFETIGLINGLSKEVELSSFVVGGCGKMEQTGLNVGFGGPYVRVSKMSVQ